MSVVMNLSNHTMDYALWRGCSYDWHSHVCVALIGYKQHALIARHNAMLDARV